MDYLLRQVKGVNNLIGMDMGGTSFDVGLIVESLMPKVSEPGFYGYKPNLPMLNLDSIEQG